MLPSVGAEVLAPHLLLAVEDELHVDAGCDGLGPHQLDRGQVGPDGALVVRRAALVEAEVTQLGVRDVTKAQRRRTLLGGPAPEDRLERGGLKPPGGRRRLDVVVAVDQDGAAGDRRGQGPVHRRVAAGLHDLCGEASGLHGPGQPFGSRPDPPGILGDRVVTQEFGESLDDRAMPGGDRAGEALPVRLERAHGPTLPGRDALR